MQQLASVAAMLAMPLPLPAQERASAQGSLSHSDELDIELMAFSGYRANRDDEQKNVVAELEPTEVVGDDAQVATLSSAVGSGCDHHQATQ